MTKLLADCEMGNVFLRGKKPAVNGKRNGNQWMTLQFTIKEKVGHFQLSLIAIKYIVFSIVTVIS